MEYDSKYTNYQVNRSRIRYFVRSIYLKNILKFIKGKCIDFGCGSGDLLGKLPIGSIGFDINASSIEHCKKNNLNAEIYCTEDDNYQLKKLKENYYTTIIFNHVLEHIENSRDVIKILFASAERLNIKKVIIVVPGIKGFSYDKTHKTFIDLNYIYENKLECLNCFEITHKKYFPVNLMFFSKYFTHNELVLVYEKK